MLSLLLTDLLVSNNVSKTIKENQEEKATMIARVVAKSDVVKEGLIEAENDRIQSYTEQVLQATEVLFIVVLNMDGIRMSHPNREMIGKRFQGGDEAPVLEGKEHISISRGTLEASLRSFVPVYDDRNNQIGAVAVGISLENVQEAVKSSHQILIVGSLLGLLVGVVGATLLASYIKRTLFGLEPFQIAKILEERNTMLQSVREGIVAVDKDAKITLVNKSALRLFKKAGLSESPIGLNINEYMPTSRLDHILKTGESELDEEQVINGVSLLVNRVPLKVEGEIVGAISTFRDKTEVNQLAEQLTGVKLYAEALRSQSHEFMNRLHVILGMVKMGYYDKLASYINQIVKHRHEEVGMVTKNIKDPALSGFVLGKLSYAREAGVELTISSTHSLPEPKNTETTHELITILGNLVDNAIDAVRTSPEKRINVKLDFLIDSQTLKLEVSDTGSGIKETVFSSIFQKGFSTKGQNRGYGLYLVKQSIDKLGGTLTVDSFKGRGTTFYVDIPYEKRGAKDD